MLCAVLRRKQVEGEEERASVSFGKIVKRGVVVRQNMMSNAASIM